MTIHDFIKERQHLIWYVKDYDALDEASIVEHTLNYGDFDDFKKLCEIMGIERVAQVFRENTENRMRINYDEKTKHYFTLYFDKYAPRNIDRKSTSAIVVS